MKSLKVLEEKKVGKTILEIKKQDLKRKNYFWKKRIKVNGNKNNWNNDRSIEFGRKNEVGTGKLDRMSK